MHNQALMQLLGRFPGVVQVKKLWFSFQHSKNFLLLIQTIMGERFEIITSSVTSPLQGKRILDLELVGFFLPNEAMSKIILMSTNNLELKEQDHKN